MNKTPEISEEPVTPVRCGADLYLRLHPSGEEGRFELRPDLRKILLVSAVAGIPAIVCLVGWLMYPWGDHPYDIQMKWIALLIGLVLSVLTVWFSTACWRFRRSGRRLNYDSNNQLLAWSHGVERHEWTLKNVCGLQLIRHHITSQLNLVVRENDGIVRKLVHHDLCHRIDRLVDDFHRETDLEVISEVQLDGNREKNPLEIETPKSSAESKLICPSCKTPFPPKRYQELRQFCFRRAAKCDHCGATLIAARGPWWLMHAAAFLTVVALTGPILVSAFPGLESSGGVVPSSFLWLLLVSLLLWFPAVRHHRLTLLSTGLPSETFTKTD